MNGNACTCDPGPEGQHQWYCGPVEVAVAAAVAAERKRIAGLLDAAGARYQKQVGWPVKASDLLREA